MATASLKAATRATIGKGAARKLRAAGQIPGVIYGHHRAPEALALPTREFERLLERINVSTTVIELDLGGKTARSLIREVQRHPFKKQILHVDFQELVAGEKITVNVPIVYTGSAIGVKEGGVLDQIMHEISIEVDPAAIPDKFEVNVTPLAIGKSIHVSDLAVPAGARILDDASQTVCIVSAPKTHEETPAAEAPAEPELIRKPKGEDAEAEKK